MELNLPAMATACCVTGESFVEDERVVSHLVRQSQDGEIVRLDVRESHEGEVEISGRVACRWIHIFKPKVAEENPEKELKLTAENLFLTLADPSAELSLDETRLVQFLALMLERKRLIRPQGKTEDGTKEIYRHRGSKGLYHVPVGELSPEFFIAVQEQLSILVGSPDEEEGGAAGGKGEETKKSDGNQPELPMGG